MRFIIAVTILMSFSTLIYAGAPAVPKSLSPNGKIHAVMDIDRDPKISPEWKGDSFPQIEITDKATGKVLVSIQYFGAAASDQRPLREHVEISWRPDSKAFAVNIHDRFYTAHSAIFVLNKKGQFVSIHLPELSYEEMTGFPTPDVKHLRPRGRDYVSGWDKEGRLIYNIFRVPLPTFTGRDPLKHKIFFRVSPAKITLAKVEHEKGMWKYGNWIKDTAKQTDQKPKK